MTDETKKENFEGHGNNWAVFDKSGEEGFIELAKEVIDDEKALVKTHGDFFCTIGLEPPIRVLALMRKDDESKKNLLDSMFPFFQIGNPTEVKVEEIKEWSTKGEAVIEGSVSGISMSFFDALYFLNKDKYKIGNTYVFNLAGLAHSFMKRTDNLEITPDKGPMKGEKINSSRMTAYFPSKDYGGEFSFAHPFTSFDGEVQVFGQKLYRYQFYVLAGMDDQAPLSFPLFVSEKILKGYKPELNDPITGTGWLQGYLADTLRD